MAIPDFQSIMKPLLQYAADNPEELAVNAVITAMADKFNLTPEERAEPLPSGAQSRIENRVYWVLAHLKMAGLLQSSRRGYTQITEEGKQVIAKNPPEINLKFLQSIDVYREYKESHKGTRKHGTTVEVNEEEKTQTPEEMIAAGMETLNASLAEELYGKICRNSPAFFERLVLDLLSKMGYGQGRVTGQSGDGGIDGFINQDSLGLEQIYFQAKRYTGDTKVTASQVRDFVGSLALKHVSKGVFITSSDFPSNAEKDLESQNIVLINREKLLDLMIRYNVGVSVLETHEVKRIDSDYFEVD